MRVDRAALRLFTSTAHHIPSWVRKVVPGGQAGYIRYKHQILVSVWVALELMLAKKKAGEIEIEPPSDEDIAAKLQGVDPTSVVKASET